MKKLRLVSLLLAAIVLMEAEAQTDSTAVRKDSVTWNQSLDGVTVTAQRQLIKQDIDRIGYDVQADEDSRTENVLDMLRKVPMVTIDGNENILVKGNSDYKIKEILKAMPANSVKRIEVITDPGAREDAEGVNAILNIVMMDTRKMDGVTGSIRGNYSSLNSVGVGTYLATQLGKTIVSIDYGYNRMSKKSTGSEGSIERTFVESGNTQKVSQTSSNPGYIHYADINASYDIDTLNLLSASFGGYFYKIDVQGDNSMTMLNAANSPLYHYNDHFWLPSYNHHSWNGRLDYEHKTHRRGEMLTLSRTFLSTTRDSF